MHCLITAGPTYEPLDAVRRLTNFSTGRLGSELADHLVTRGHEVTLLLGELASRHPASPRVRVIPFSTTEDLGRKLESLSGQPHAVFHAAAVSDFKFGVVSRKLPDNSLAPVHSGKFSTREGPHYAELIPTPKLIHRLRNLFPQAKLIGWKFEVDGDRQAAIEAARIQIQESRTDGCVANGPAYGPGFGLVTPSTHDHAPDRPALLTLLDHLIS